MDADEEYRKVHDALNEEACRQEKPYYVDPLTSNIVFTSLYLKTRPCCKSGCRHCPYGFKEKEERNVLK